jgi:hypothetical protein
VGGGWVDTDVHRSGSIVTIFMYYLAPFPQIIDHFAWQYLVWWSL